MQAASRGRAARQGARALAAKTIRARRASGLAFAALAFAATGADAQTADAPDVTPMNSSLLPPTGIDGTIEDLRGFLLDAFGQTTPLPPGQAASGPAWKITPAIGVAEEFTDNAQQFGVLARDNRTSADAVTSITPELTVTANTQRVQVTLRYAPTGEIFASNSSFDQFRQDASGTAQVTLMPGLFYVDLRGSLTENPVFGGYGLVNTTILPPDQRELQSNAGATPYIARSFGGLGTMQAGAGYYYTATDAPGVFNALAPGAYGSQWLATRRLFASFTTGEDLGRFQDRLGSDNSFYDGSGPSRDAHRITVLDDASYAVNRIVAALGEIGYENLDYPHSSYRYVGGVWAAGLRLTPNGASTLTAEMRHLDGITAPYVHGAWQVTPRLRIFGDYSQGIVTFEQDQQDQLLAGNTTESGARASALTAAPLLNNGALFGSNQALTRSERWDASASYVAGRDVITASVNHQRSSVIGNTLGLSQNTLQAYGITQALLAVYGYLVTDTSGGTVYSLTWQHDLQPDLVLSVLGAYNHVSAAETNITSFSTAQTQISLRRQFTRSLSASLTYAGTYAVGANGTASGARNTDTVTISLRKAF